MIFIFALALILLPISIVFAGCEDVDNASTQNETKIVVPNTSIKTIYEVGEELEITGGILEFIENGTTNYVPLTKEMISNFSTEKYGNYQMIITYNSYTTTLNYTVEAYSFSLSQIYKSTIDDSHYTWIKFDTDQSTFTILENGTKACPTTDEWIDYGKTVSYTQSIKNNVVCIESEYENYNLEFITQNKNSFTATFYENANSNTEFNFYAYEGPETFDFSKIYKYTLESGHCEYIKFDTTINQLTILSNMSNGVKPTDSDWSNAEFTHSATYIKSVKNDTVTLNANYIDQESIISLEIVANGESSFIATYTSQDFGTISVVFNAIN